MFVLTIDQIGSRTGHDRVPDLLERLASIRAPGPSGATSTAAATQRVTFLRGPERTVGDEVQAVLVDAADVVLVALDLLRIGNWSVGIGVGPVVEPLPPSTREGSGEAFVRAREAVERAKAKGPSVPVAVEGPTPAADAEAVLRLLGAILARRTPLAWDAIDAVAHGALTQKDAAKELGITVQAVSRRLRAALWADEQAVRPLAVRLLQEADT